MIDLLYRFNVLNTAFSVIGSEIKEKFGQVGGCWHICLFLWTLYFTLQGLWDKEFDYDLCYTSGTVFLIASKYLLFMENVVQKIKILRFLDFKITRKLATFAMNLSIFPVLWFFAIIPVYNGLSSIVKSVSGFDGYAYGAIGSILLLLAVSGLICSYLRRNKKPAAKTSNIIKPKVRPPSARIAARQSQNEKKTRPVSATPIRRRHRDI